MMEVCWVTAPTDSKVKSELRMASFTENMSVKTGSYLGFVISWP